MRGRQEERNERSAEEIGSGKAGADPENCRRVSAGFSEELLRSQVLVKARERTGLENLLYVEPLLVRFE